MYIPIGGTTTAALIRVKKESDHTSKGDGHARVPSRSTFRVHSRSELPVTQGAAKRHSQNPPRAPSIPMIPQRPACRILIH